MVEEKKKYALPPFPLPLPSFSPEDFELPEEPTRIISSIDAMAKMVEEMARRIDRTLSFTTEPKEVKPVVSPPIRLRPEYVKQMHEELDVTKRNAEEGLRLIRQGKIPEAAKALMDYSEKAGKGCSVCEEMFRKAALEVSLAGLSKGLGEVGWEGKLREAERTLNKLIEAVPRIKKSIEAY